MFIYLYIYVSVYVDYMYMYLILIENYWLKTFATYRGCCFRCDQHITKINRSYSYNVFCINVFDVHMYLYLYMFVYNAS